MSGAFSTAGECAAPAHDDVLGARAARPCRPGAPASRRRRRRRAARASRTPASPQRLHPVRLGEQGVAHGEQPGLAAGEEAGAQEVAEVLAHGLRPRVLRLDRLHGLAHRRQPALLDQRAQELHHVGARAAERPGAGAHQHEGGEGRRVLQDRGARHQAAEAVAHQVHRAAEGAGGLEQVRAERLDGVGGGVVRAGRLVLARAGRPRPPAARRRRAAAAAAGSPPCCRCSRAPAGPCRGRARRAPGRARRAGRTAGRGRSRGHRAAAGSRAEPRQARAARRRAPRRRAAPAS